MANKPAVLNEIQLKFLELFGKSRKISSKFYLSGGAAFTGFYIPYRYSEDLDFFSEGEVEVSAVIAFIKSCKLPLGYRRYSYNTSYNRNLFFLEFPNQCYTLKTEFTYFPFTTIDKQKKYLGVSIDSIYDIAVNKLFTIYQKPRCRDFMDLYMIVKKHGYTLDDLVSKASAKFDWNIDLLKLGAQFLQARDVKDFPKLIIKLEDDAWVDYFLEMAKNLKAKFTK